MVKLVEGASFTDCAACHGSRTVLPPKHVSLDDEKNQDCSECHSEKKNSLRGKTPLSHAHMANDVACADCHDKKPYDLMGSDQCRECHGQPEEIADLTKTDDVFNPHDSPHYGNEVDCDLCHHVHKKSENVCGDCHDLKKPTP